MTKEKSQCQAEFEKWAQKNNFDLSIWWGCKDKPPYYNKDTLLAYRIWCAAWQAATKESDKVYAEMEKAKQKRIEENLRKHRSIG